MGFKNNCNTCMPMIPFKDTTRFNSHNRPIPRVMRPQPLVNLNRTLKPTITKRTAPVTSSSIRSTQPIHVHTIEQESTLSKYSHYGLIVLVASIGYYVYQTQKKH